MVFSYLDAFDRDAEAVAELKAHYRRGGLPDATVKTRLERVLEELLGPIREHRAALALRPDDVLDILDAGSRRGRALVAPVLAEVREVFGLGRRGRHSNRSFA